jgi:hypothetical protein
MAFDSASIFFTFGVPLLLLGFNKSITVRIWAVLYLCSILSTGYLIQNDFSAIWMIVLFLSTISTMFLASLSVILSPLQTPLLLRLLEKTKRDSEDMGIRDIYVPTGERAEIEIE